ncbi:MAG: DUF4145 domain-containing protein [Selenomonadaceae bacterium]|nr:DUF4145 domain-containing protein [Selenomonadaceae bacterium]
MANFSVLENVPEYRSFAKACIDAENSFKTSPDNCVKTSRTALESVMNWIYNRNKNLIPESGEGGLLYRQLSGKNFQKIIDQNLLRRLQWTRKICNDVIHVPPKVPTDQQAKNCLENVFDLVKWLDRYYGINRISKSFDRDDIPTEDTLLDSALKYGAAALGGAAVLGLAILANKK